MSFLIFSYLIHFERVQFDADCSVALRELNFWMISIHSLVPFILSKWWQIYVRSIWLVLHKMDFRKRNVLQICLLCRIISWLQSDLCFVFKKSMERISIVLHCVIFKLLFSFDTVGSSGLLVEIMKYFFVAQSQYLV